MDNNENQVIIGVRGTAKQAIVASIILIPIVLSFSLLFGFWIPYLFAEGDFSKFFNGPNPFFVGFAFAFAFSSIYYVIVSLVRSIKNNNMLPKPVLVYDKERDVFIGYSLRQRNKQIVIPNGNIIGMSGSVFWTARELFITYKTSNGKTRKDSFGFARNIDNHVLRNLFNQYSKNKI